MSAARQCMYNFYIKQEHTKAKLYRKKTNTITTNFHKSQQILIYFLTPETIIGLIKLLLEGNESKKNEGNLSQLQ